ELESRNAGIVARLPVLKQGIDEINRASRRVEAVNASHVNEISATDDNHVAGTQVGCDLGGWNGDDGRIIELAGTRDQHIDGSVADKVRECSFGLKHFKR